MKPNKTADNCLFSFTCATYKKWQAKVCVKRHKQNKYGRQKVVDS